MSSRREIVTISVDEDQVLELGDKVNNKIAELENNNKIILFMTRFDGTRRASDHTKVNVIGFYLVVKEKEY